MTFHELAEIVADTWRPSVADRLEVLDWERAATDVRPFLERIDDAALVTKDSVLRLLARPG